MAGRIGNNDDTVYETAVAVTTAICNHVGTVVSIYDALFPAPAVHNEFPNRFAKATLENIKTIKERRFEKETQKKY